MNTVPGSLVLACTVLIATSCDSPLPPAPLEHTASSASAALVGIPAEAGEASRITLGMALSPVPLNMEGRNPALVGLGSYIANATSPCADCHSNPQWAAGGNPYLGQPKMLDPEGYLRGGSQAFGPFVPRNLTPNSQGLPAGLTLDQFLQVLNTGADLKGRPPFVPSAEQDLLQVMPWPMFREMTHREKLALYEYLSAIPCRGSATRCGVGD